MLASRISYVGDLGWELYVPIEQGARLWDLVWEAGEPHGLVPAGIGVYGTTGRLEKCYRAYGTELESEYTAVEAGMAGPRVKEQDFVGREAHLRQRDEEPVAVLCTLTVDDHTSASGAKRFVQGREPVLTRDGAVIVDAKGRRSYVTSAGAGPSVRKHILLAYLPPEHAVAGAELAVEYLGERYPVSSRRRRLETAVRPRERSGQRPSHPDNDSRLRRYELPAPTRIPGSSSTPGSAGRRSSTPRAATACSCTASTTTCTTHGTTATRSRSTGSS